MQVEIPNSADYVEAASFQKSRCRAGLDIKWTIAQILRNRSGAHPILSETLLSLTPGIAPRKDAKKAHQDAEERGAWEIAFHGVRSEPAVVRSVRPRGQSGVVDTADGTACGPAVGVWDMKRWRYRQFSIAGKLISSARQRRLLIPKSGPESQLFASLIEGTN